MPKKKIATDFETKPVTTALTPKYKMIPVDLKTYERLVVLGKANGRKQGAQVRVMVDAEWAKYVDSVRIIDQQNEAIENNALVIK